MPIPFACPHCGKSTVVDDRFAGQTGPCSACGQMVTVPFPGGAPIYPKPSGGGGTAALIIGIAAAGLVGSVCVIGILVALLLPAVQAAREAARRSQSSNNLKQIGIALHNYHDTHGTFPPAYVADEDGTPLYSWRVLILPFMEQGHIYDQWDKEKAWDSPENIHLSNTMIATFRSPSDNLVAPNGTSYVALIDPKGVFSGPEGTNFAQIKDGTSNTLMVISVKGISGSWAAPIDPVWSETSKRIGNQPGDLQVVHPGGTMVLLADGSVKFLSNSTDSQTLESMVLRDDGRAFIPPW
jgi:prepilin-type processing-associated H-X9-DG protein